MIYVNNYIVTYITSKIGVECFVLQLMNFPYHKNHTLLEIKDGDSHDENRKYSKYA